MSGVEAEFKVDDSKISIIRGPASLRDIAIKFFNDARAVHDNARRITDIADDDLDQVIAWLQSMEV